MKLHADTQSIDDILSKLKEITNENNKSNLFYGITTLRQQLEILNTNGWKGTDSNNFCSNYLNYLDYMQELFISYQKLTLMIDDANNKYREIDDLKNYFMEDNNTFNMSSNKTEQTKEDNVEIIAEEGD